MKSKYQDKELDTNKMSFEEKYLYKSWVRSSKEMKVSSEEQANIAYIEVVLRSLKKHDKIVREEMGKEEYTVEELEKFTPTTDAGKRAKMGVLQILKIFGVEGQTKNTEIIGEVEEYVEGKKATF
ncbi:MAG: hypothetical protein H3C56_06345, partial [Chitinophagaceae bacterium]|nr:hypothetical protein [Chitinophagaceae bacterium]